MRDNPEPETLAEALSVYLGAGVDRLRVLASGWETTLYEFALRARTELVAGVEAGTPLVLRLYPSVEAAEQGAQEYRTIRELAAAGYPVPRPYLFEPGGAAIGAPFLVMERLRGGPLFAIRSFPQAFKTFSLGFLGFVRAQARLHRMALSPSMIETLEANAASNRIAPGRQTAGTSVRGTPAAATSVSLDGAAARMLDRALETIAARVESGPLPGLAEALAYLRRRASEFRAAPPSIIHMDYHPQNVMVEGTRVTGVIDWAHAAMGDRHFDAATTAVILSTSAMEHPRWMRDNVAGNSLRRNFYALYVALYHAMAPMELKRFRYYQAVAAALRLSMLGMMRVRGPASVGLRPGSINEVTPAVLRLLSRRAARKTGVRVTVP